jgi:hypothetical protein
MKEGGGEEGQGGGTNAKIRLPWGVFPAFSFVVPLRHHHPRRLGYHLPDRRLWVSWKAYPSVFVVPLLPLPFLFADARENEMTRCSIFSFLVDKR